jgi:hypothetical protein
MSLRNDDGGGGSLTANGEEDNAKDQENSKEDKALESVLTDKEKLV